MLYLWEKVLTSENLIPRTVHAYKFANQLQRRFTNEKKVHF
jgi:hypothetical protein